MFNTWMTLRCEELSLSQGDLAGLLGVDASEVESWFEGEEIEFEMRSRISERVGDPHHPPGLWSTSTLDADRDLDGLVVAGGIAGVGHLVEVEETSATVRYFDGPEAPLRNVIVPRSTVRVARLSPQTRVFVRDETFGRWIAGRARWYDSTNRSYSVDFPDRVSGVIAEREVQVRTPGIRPDPIEILAAKAHETAFFHAVRVPLAETLVEHRSRTRGLSGLVSSRIDLLPHQVGVVRRVSTDPVQRYLLADEVGLGKTIEACALARQHLIDRPDSRVLILVPRQLVSQWEGEWRDRFAIYPFDPRIEIASYDEATRQRLFAPSLVIVDEAHHVAGLAWDSSETGSATWHAVADLAHTAQGVLLLSATPAPANTDAYLAMLHLLDPLAYPLSDRSGFNKRVELQDELGRKMLALEEDAPPFLLEHAARELRSLLEDDPAIVERVDHLMSILDDDPEVIRTVVRQLRAWVSSTYRLHRRMLRSRREQAKATPHGRSDDRIREEWGFDNRTSEVLDAIEQWRLDASASESGQRYASLHRVLLEVACTDLEFLATVVGARLAGTVAPDDLEVDDAEALGLEFFPGERDSLNAMVIAARSPLMDGQLDQAGLLVEALTRPLSRGERAVVFVSYPSVAERLYAHLCASLGEDYVMRRLASLTPDVLDREATQFADTPGSVLVCDRSGEEGINFQHAHHAVLYDLPFSPNRLEQRIGRLDRIGRTSRLSIWVLPGPEGRGSEVTASEAWLAVLRQGFGIFRKSAAPLQFLVSRLTPQLVETLHREGADALLASQDEVAAEVAKEEHQAAAQDLVDAADYATEAADLMPELKLDDEFAEELSNAIHGWMSQALRFRPVRVGEGISYFPMEGTLLPTDAVLNRFLPLAVRPATFVREVALRSRRVELARAGHPLVDQVMSSLSWEDRGLAAAFLRRVHNLPDNFSWSGFRLDLTVEVDLYAALIVLEKRGINNVQSRASLRRRADSLYPPHFVTSVIDVQGEVLEARGTSSKARIIFGFVVAGFDKHKGDTNLHKNRLDLIDTYVPPHEWVRRVRQVNAASKLSVQNSGDVARRSAEGVERVRRERADRLPVLLARAARDGSYEAAQLEEELLAALEKGVAAPSLVLNAAAFVALEGGSDGA